MPPDSPTFIMGENKRIITRLLPVLIDQVNHNKENFRALSHGKVMTINLLFLHFPRPLKGVFGNNHRDDLIDDRRRNDRA